MVVSQSPGQLFTQHSRTSSKCARFSVTSGGCWCTKQTASFCCVQQLLSARCVQLPKQQPTLTFCPVGRQLAREKKITKRAAQLYLDMSEKGRHLVETYFNLKQPLYFDYTHLVCRTALDGEGRSYTHTNTYNTHTHTHTHRAPLLAPRVQNST